MSPYNGFTTKEINYWSAEQRRLLNRHPECRPTVCAGCGLPGPGVEGSTQAGATGGIIPHLEDYRMPLHGIIGLCLRCHVMVHMRHRYPAAWARYLEAMHAGTVFPPAVSWRQVLRELCWERAYAWEWRRNQAGPPRGPGILDRIGEDRWVDLGSAHRHQLEIDMDTGKDSE